MVAAAHGARSWASAWAPPLTSVAAPSVRVHVGPIHRLRQNLEGQHAVTGSGFPDEVEQVLPLVRPRAHSDAAARPGRGRLACAPNRV